METAMQLPTRSAAAIWTARGLRGLVILFWIFDAVSHIVMPPPVVDAFQRLGLASSVGLSLGIIMIPLLVLYVVPRTSVFGAVLLTGYLGGATAIQLRAGSPAFETLFPVLFGILVWAPLYLTDARARGLFQ